MRWIVFDFGEVISRRNPAIPAMAARLGVSVERFESAYWDRDAYDRGGSDVPVITPNRPATSRPSAVTG